MKTRSVSVLVAVQTTDDGFCCHDDCGCLAGGRRHRRCTLFGNQPICELRNARGQAYALERLEDCIAAEQPEVQP